MLGSGKLISILGNLSLLPRNKAEYKILSIYCKRELNNTKSKQVLEVKFSFVLAVLVLLVQVFY